MERSFLILMGFFDFLKGGKGPAPLTLGAVASGNVVPMDHIQDAVFSQGIMGMCCGVDPEDGSVYSPIDGQISQLTDTRHAVGLQAGELELLVHAGLDTVEMKGDGFTNAVQVGQTVKRGDLLLTMDLEKVRQAGHGTTVVLAVINSDDLGEVALTASGRVKAGDDVMQIKN